LIVAGKRGVGKIPARRSRLMSQALDLDLVRFQQLARRTIYARDCDLVADLSL